MISMNKARPMKDDMDRRLIEPPQTSKSGDALEELKMQARQIMIEMGYLKDDEVSTEAPGQ